MKILEATSKDRREKDSTSERKEWRNGGKGSWEFEGMNLGMLMDSMLSRTEVPIIFFSLALLSH